MTWRDVNNEGEMYITIYYDYIALHKNINDYILVCVEKGILEEYNDWDQTWD